MGRSFGGLIATNMANTTIGRSMFAGVVLLTPYFRHARELLYQVYKYVKTLAFAHPYYIFKCNWDPPSQEYLEKYRQLIEDPKNIEFYTAQTACIWVEEQTKTKEQTKTEGFNLPACIVKASEDDVVNNDTIDEFAQMANNEQNEFHTV